MATFSKGLFASEPYQANEGRIASLTYPTGEKLTFTYGSVFVCADPQACPTEPEVRVYRLAKVANNQGYELNFAYAMNQFSITPGQIGLWSSIQSVSARNRAADPANPPA